MTASLDGRVALVTGASRRQGIGAAICRALASQGADICFTYWQDYDRGVSGLVDANGPATLERDLQAMSVRCAGLEADLSRPDAAHEVLDAVQARLGAPSILVNNATHSTQSDYHTLDAATLDAHYAVNVRATLLLSVAFARRYPGGPGGRIISLTSGQSLGPMPDELAYIATKGAIEAFTLSLSPAVMGHGITVNAVNPGPTDTGWMTDEIRADVTRKSPTGRTGRPEDAARLVAFLAGDDASWITGQVIHSEGGFLRR